ncbi:hypothetical protein D9619_002300 [Psilocybe cf. subviscida]|uniref:Uncharacterized protein n=1 Tax=Psilocybe cf. subviscida TaxID=2480587 RepID=A0A8H5BD21_9AGAR|nr:hypothetical protein D9619_002300 [Psilocybe cf. subviscida]
MASTSRSSPPRPCPHRPQPTSRTPQTHPASVSPSSVASRYGYRLDSGEISIQSIDMDGILARVGADVRTTTVPSATAAGGGGGGGSWGKSKTAPKRESSGHPS